MPAVLAVLLLLVLAAPARAGVSGTIAISTNGMPGTTVEERAARYKRLADAGVELIRFEIRWADAEPPGEPRRDFDFSRYDRELAAARRAGLRAIGLLGYGHPDHSSAGGLVAATPAREGVGPFGNGRAEFFPPDDPRDFAVFARAAAEHFGDEVVAWEVWNEENGGWRFWPPREDPRAYGALLCAAADALRAADPRTPVLFGGMFFPEIAGLPGQGAVPFLRSTYAAHRDLDRCMDAVAYHPYAYPFTAPELDVPVRGSVLSAHDQLRAVTAKPLWITEVGWPTHERAYGVGELRQAQYLARMLGASFAQGVPVVTWYTYGDEADPSGANQEAWFGLHRADDSPKPAYWALRTFSRQLRNRRFAADRSEQYGLPPGGTNTGGRGFALEFRSTRDRTTMAWAATEGVADAQGPRAQTDSAPAPDLRLPTGAEHAVVTDLLGTARVVRAEDGVIRLRLGPSPQYVLDLAPGARRGCRDSRSPRSAIRALGRRRVSGRATDRGCAGVARVLVALAREAGRGRCRAVDARGRLRAPAPCRPRHHAAADGTRRWALRLPRPLPRGRYRVWARAIDARGNAEPEGRTRARLPVR